MVLVVDTFWSEFNDRLVTTGWVLTEGSRYDPTHIYGITPTGKAFELHMVDNKITATVAGRSRNLTRFKNDWERGDLSVDAIIAAYENLPASWR